MKLQVLFGAAVTAVTINKPNASNFLQRFRRANEGYFSEFTAGNLERECIEESCTKTEFYEVYDDDGVSGPLYAAFRDCWNSFDYIDSIRECVNGRRATQRG